MSSDTTDPEIGRPWVGIGWMIVTGLLFVCVTGIVRYVGSDVPAAQAAFIRYIIGLALILPFMGPSYNNKQQRYILFLLHIHAVKLTHHILPFSGWAQNV